jgi:hypothetical protein
MPAEVFSSFGKWMCIRCCLLRIIVIEAKSIKAALSGYWKYTCIDYVFCMPFPDMDSGDGCCSAVHLGT